MQGARDDGHKAHREKQTRASRIHRSSLAHGLNLDLQRFTEDLGTGQHSRRVQEDLRDAETSGVSSVPTSIVDGRRHTGQHDAETLDQALSAALGDDGHDPHHAHDGDMAHRAGKVMSSRTRASSLPPVSAAVVALPQLRAARPEMPDHAGDHPRLTDAQIDRLARAGTRRTVERGDTLHRSGDASDNSYVVVSGAVAVVEHLSDDHEATVRVHGHRRFLGELDPFGDTPVGGTAVVVRAGEVVALSVKQLRSVLVQDTQPWELLQRYIG